MLTEQKRRIRVVIGKVGLDGHEAGAKLIARGLMDHGMEVCYTGMRQTPEQVVMTVIQEAADVLGLSSLSGAHSISITRVLELLKERQVGDILVIAGGLIPKADATDLIDKGVRAVFGPGSKIEDIVKFIIAKVRTDK